LYEYPLDINTYLAFNCCSINILKDIDIFKKLLSAGNLIFIYFIDYFDIAKV